MDKQVGKQMDKHTKVIMSGLAISGAGILFVPLLFDKTMIVINMLIFIGFTVAGMMKVFESKGVTIKDLDGALDKKMAQSYKQKQYANFFLYTSIRPLIMVALIAVFLYMITFLIF